MTTHRNHNHRRTDPYEGTYLTGKNLLGVLTVGAIGVSLLVTRRLGFKQSLILGSHLVKQMAGPYLKSIDDIISLTLHSETITQDDGALQSSAMSISMIKRIAATHTRITVFGLKKRYGKWVADRQLKGKLFHLQDDNFIIKDHRSDDYLIFQYEDISNVFHADGSVCLSVRLPYKV